MKEISSKISYINSSKDKAHFLEIAFKSYKVSISSNKNMTQKEVQSIVTK